MLFRSLKRGFLNGCSPFLFFDGCHLRGRYGGVLLSAVATDANCGIFPVAWAIVESECKNSWGFFLTCLEQFIGPFEADNHWHFMADRQKVRLTGPSILILSCCCTVFVSVMSNYLFFLFCYLLGTGAYDSTVSTKCHK